MPKTPKPPATNQELFPGEAEPKDFESAIQELEKLVVEMEEGRLSLEDSLAAYKRGVSLSAYCQRSLDNAETQIKALENGVLKDFKPQGRNGDA
ncbi:MAG: exodeoxyribonuclease VII small subunit [Thiobacillaceae bacterium]|jgi:exodeoxyribonuclease VII small subunit|nr:exodeoxyribonuclease VII small subunit [Hydrogenophilales bacterium]MBP8902248.1 exodeoxyribonuclease VII small subunit [Thiobacillaceae bacterium]MBP9915436.1 exodeoxyribonuclease VII small subunit [Thiobacillaceae bacterium]